MARFRKLLKSTQLTSGKGTQVGRLGELRQTHTSPLESQPKYRCPIYPKETTGELRKDLAAGIFMDVLFTTGKEETTKYLLKHPNISKRPELLWSIYAVGCYEVVNTLIES